MRHASLSSPRPSWWTIHQQALQLFRDLDTLQRVRPYLELGGLASRRLEREQAQIEAAIEALCRQARTTR